MTEAARRPARPEGPVGARRLLRLTAAIAGLVAVYYLLPLFESASAQTVTLRTVAAGLLLVATVWLVIRTVAHELHAEDDAIRLDHLVLAAVAGVICFALADFAVVRADETQFVGLTTKTDALYFAMTTLTTVGFGDIHAQGQFARQLVLIQLVFNLVVLASAARTFSRGLSRRRARPPGTAAGDVGDARQPHLPPSSPAGEARPRVPPQGETSTRPGRTP